MIKSYYELAKPGIIYGNLLTAIAGYLLAARLHIKIESFLGMVVGLALVIGSACTFNNLYDRDIDSKMDRTKHRPSVSGAIGFKAGLIYGTLLAIIGLLILGFLTNLLTLLIAALGFVVYTTAYTFAKRKTHYATLIGSISGATPIVAGYVAYSGHLSAAAWLIGLMMLVWQMPHFYAIAIYREKDYRAAGVPVLPVVAGKRATSYWMVVYSALFIVASMLLYITKSVGLAYLIVMGVTGLFWLVLNIEGLFVKSLDKWAKRSFLSSLIVVIVMSAALALH